ncbi:hypothetical protein MAY76_17600 [Edwardsiella ictaluri]|nr:hypothetical protein MAY76_17600 [Edwardsiella ictaluri]
MRLYRPFSAHHLLAALPLSAQRIAVLDRTKEPGALGEPLYLDIIAALAQAVSSGERTVLPLTIGGRYGLSSKEFGPDCALAVFEEWIPHAPDHALPSVSTMMLPTSPCRAGWMSTL